MGRIAPWGLIITALLNRIFKADVASLNSLRQKGVYCEEILAHNDCASIVLLNYG